MSQFRLAYLCLYWQTLQHLRVKQLVYLVVYRLRPRPRLKNWPARLPYTPLHGQSVCFLNQSVTFATGIDWNYAQYGKLWTYHLNYFDCLNDNNLSPETGLALIRDFIGQTARLRDGLEPYPTSVRLVHWIDFLARHQLSDPQIDAHIRAQIRLLRGRLEYHLSGNHLLENALALLMGSVYCQQGRWLAEATALLMDELPAQLVSDGAHYERSPVYHQLLLSRLLTVYRFVKTAKPGTTDKLAQLLATSAARMLGWLEAITFANGEVPMVNDAAAGVAPTTAELLAHAATLGITTRSAILGDSGYRMFRTATVELFANAGAIGPAHQPGHAHADTLGFIVQVRGKPIITDVGTSTYAVGQRRQWERSTAAHNTVTVGGANSSAVWAGFRVGQRARVEVVAESASGLRARHDGYRRQFSVVHERTWELLPDDQLRITDALLGNLLVEGVARLYFHSEVPVRLRNTMTLYAGPLLITFGSPAPMQLAIHTYQRATGFNRLALAQMVSITFTQFLQTHITLQP